MNSINLWKQAYRNKFNPRTIPISRKGFIFKAQNDGDTNQWQSGLQNFDYDDNYLRELALNYDNWTGLQKFINKEWENYNDEPHKKGQYGNYDSFGEAGDVEQNKQYQAFTNYALNNDDFRYNWYKLVDKYLNNTEAKWFDDNGKLRKWWTATNRNSTSGLNTKYAPTKIGNSLLRYTKDTDRFQGLRNDNAQGIQHSIQYLNATRYYYLDENGERRYVKTPDNLDDYILGDPEDVKFTDDVDTDLGNLTKWRDVEIKGLKNNSPSTEDLSKVSIENATEIPISTNPVIKTSETIDLSNITNNTKSKSKVTPTGGNDDTKINLNGETGIKSRNNILSGLNNWLPEALELAGHLSAVRNNNKNRNILKKAYRPALKNPYELRTPIRGNYAAIQHANNEVAQQMSQAYKPVTSDMSLHLANIRDTWNKGQDQKWKAWETDNAAIEASRKEARDRREKTILNHNEVANENRAAIVQNRIMHGKIDASANNLNTKSLNNLVSNWAALARNDRQEKKEATYNAAVLGYKQEYEDVVNQIEKLFDPQGNRTYADLIHNKRYTEALNNAQKIYQNNIIKLSANPKHIYKYGTTSNLTYKQLLESLTGDLWEDSDSSTTSTSTESVPVVSGKRKEGGKLFNNNSSKPIIKHAEGGSFDYYFTAFEPTSSPQTRSSKSTKSATTAKKDDDDGLTTSDLFNLIKDAKGLPNELGEIFSEFQTIFRYMTLHGGISPSRISSMYINNLYKIRIAEQNLEKFKEAEKAATTNGALGEEAISLEGNVIVQDPQDGKLMQVTPQEYINNPDKYIKVSNSKLANLRKNSQALAFDVQGDIFNILAQGVGFESFQKVLDTAKINLGTVSNEIKGSFAVDQATRGLQILEQLKISDPDEANQLLQSISDTGKGVYEYSKGDKDNAQAIKGYVDYLISVLPKRMKTWAQIKTKEEDPDKAARQLIVQYLQGRRTTENKFNVTYRGDKSSSKNGKSGDSSGDSNLKASYLTMMQNGYGGEKGKRNLLIGQGNLTVSGTIYGSFADKDGNALSNLTLRKLLDDTGMAGITNQSAITFGDNIITNPNAFENIAIENKGGFWVVLPCKRENGKVTPDFSMSEKFNNLVQEVNDASSETTSYEERQKMLEQKIADDRDLSELLDPTGKIDKNKLQAFFVVSGMASDANFNFTANVDGKNETITNTNTPYIHITKDKNDWDYFEKVTENDIKDRWIDIFDDTLYKANIFIPITTTNKMAAIIFSGEKVKEDTAYEKEEEYQSFLRDPDENDSPDILFN